MNEVTHEDILSNMGLVHMVVGRNLHLTDHLVERRDLVSWGVEGLIHALERFEPERGFKFSPYAVKCIWGKMHQGLKKMYPEVERGKHSNVALGATPFCVLDGRREEDGFGPFNPLQMDEAFCSFCPFDTTSELEKRQELVAQRERVLEVADRVLSPKQRFFFGLLLQHDMNQTEVAKSLNTSRQTVNNHWRAIKRALKLWLEDDPIFANS